MKVIVAGGSGLIGRRLVELLETGGHETIVLTRRPKRSRDRQWDGRTGSGPWARELAGADAVVNLAGESVGTRPWTRRRRRAILESRVDTTRALVEAIAALPSEQRPPVLLNASGIDYAGNRRDAVVTKAADPGSTFLSRRSRRTTAANPSRGPRSGVSTPTPRRRTPSGSPPSPTRRGCGCCTPFR